MDQLLFPQPGRDSYSPTLGELLQRAETLLILGFTHEAGNACRTALELALKARCRHNNVWPKRDSGTPRTRCDIHQLADALGASGTVDVQDLANAQRLKSTVDAASHGLSVARQDVVEVLGLAKRLAAGMPLDVTADLEMASVMPALAAIPLK